MPLDYPYNMPPLDHRPVAKWPRPGHTREEIFAQAWRHLMSTKRPGCMPGGAYDHANGWLDSVLYEFKGTYRLDQRMATVAASVITWLGTNAGLSMIRTAENAAEKLAFRSRETAFHYVWSDENRRRHGVNSEVRYLESILSPTFDELQQLVNLSTRDYEVAENVFAWLGSEEGGKFVSDCLTKIEKADQHRRKIEAAQWRRANCKTYEGPIADGMEFHWELGNPDAEDRCMVQGVGDGLVWAVFQRFGSAARVISNTEQRFREAVTPC